MQIFVSYYYSQHNLWFFSNLAHIFASTANVFGVFSACSKKKQKEVSGDLHINLVVHSPGKERLFVTSCWSIFSGHTFIIYCVATSTIERHSSPMKNVCLSTLTRLIINLDYAIISPCDFFKALGKVNFSIKAQEISIGTH